MIGPVPYAAGRDPYLGAAGTDHDIVSATDGRAVFVEIELKG